MNPKVILILAAIAVSVGLYGVSQAPTESASVNVESVAEVKKIRVLLLNRQVEKGQRLERQALDVMFVSEQTANQSGINADVYLDWSKPQIAINTFEPDSFITEAHVTSPGDHDYIDVVLEPGFTPFNITVPANEVIGGTVKVGDLVDISVISTLEQNLASEETVSDLEHLTMTPLLAQVPVLQMISKQRSVSTLSIEKTTDVTLVLQVTNRQLAKLALATRIARVTVHKSLGEAFFDQLRADFSDVIQNVDSQRDAKTSVIKQYRFN